jgi:hypothetical protein
MYNQSNAITTCLEHRVKFIFFFNKIVFVYVEDQNNTLDLSSKYYIKNELILWLGSCDNSKEGNLGNLQPIYL